MPTSTDRPYSVRKTGPQYGCTEGGFDRTEKRVEVRSASAVNFQSIQSCSLKIEIKLSFEQFTELSFASRTSTPAAFCCRLRTNPLLKLLFVAGCVPLQTVPWCVALFLCKGSFSTPYEKRSRADCTALRRADFLVVKSRHPQLSMMRSQNAFCGCTTQLRTSIRYTVLGLRCFEQTKKVIENIFLREILHSLKIIGCM